MAIKVYGEAILKTRFEVELDISEEDFEAMSHRQQDALLDSQIDWKDACRNAEVDEFDVFEFYEVEK